MKFFLKFKTFIFLFVTQLLFGRITFAIDTTNMDAQSDALINNSSLAGNGDLATIMSLIIKVVLGFLGIVFLVLTIMAGFKWMMSQGNEDEIKKAQSSLKNSIIGLIIVLASYAITYAVFTYMPFASGGSGNGGGGAN